MSDAITLTLRARPEGPLDMAGVTPDVCAGLSEAAIATLPVWLGSKAAHVGDFFTVRGAGIARMTVEGELGQVHGLGAAMAGGEFVVHGEVGDRAGAGMSGGVLHVRGRAGDDAGMAMRGGTLRIDGHAGDRLGGATPGASKGMSGGEIVVFGSVGAGAAALVRRGLIAVAGGVGPGAGRAMIAGTVLALGPIAGPAGLGNKRGSIVAAAAVDVPATYRYACTYEPPHVRLVIVSLQRRFGFPADSRIRDGRYRRYCGDAGEPGKGEILVWTGG